MDAGDAGALSPQRCVAFGSRFTSRARKFDRWSFSYPSADLCKRLAKVDVPWQVIAPQPCPHIVKELGIDRAALRSLVGNLTRNECYTRPHMR